MKYAKYKETGISWLPEVPDGWEVRRLKHIVDSFRKGSGITKDEVFDDGDTPCVRYGEIYTKYNGSFFRCNSYTKKELLQNLQFFSRGDILFTCTGELVQEIGKNVVYLGDDKCLAGGDIIIASHNQDAIFLNYCLNSYQLQQQKSHGKAKLKVVHISLREIGNLLLPLPPLSEQMAIAEYLDDKCSKVDRLVEAKTKQIELFKELRQSIIADAVTKGIDGCKTFKPTHIPWLPEVPETWEVKRAGAFLSVKDAQSAPNEQLLSVFLDRGVIPFSAGGEKRANATSKDLSKYQLVEPGDLVMNNQQAWRGSVGVSQYLGIVSPAYFVVKMNNDVDPLYANFAFRSRPFVSVYEICSRGVGSIQRNLIWNSFKGQPFPLPPLAEQKRIVAYLDKKCAKIDALVAKIEDEVIKLKEYRERLVADVVTGQRKVVK